ncbi:MAG: hypothetical protein WB542_18170 [Polaromonas sp.]
MKFDNPVLLFLIGQLVTAGGTYAAIRADLREAIVTAQAAKERAVEANARIDRLQERRP